MSYFLRTTMILSVSGLLFCHRAFGDSDTACQDLAVSGIPNWDRYNGTVDISVDDDCMYTWTATFTHDPTLPVPDDPQVQCDPSVTPPVLADDGRPYFAFRWHYLKVSEMFQNITGINHLSLDFNPCGHPPLGIFTAPHYDLHTYRVSPEFRTCMTCELLPGTPVCDFTIDQPTPSGQAFFAPVTKNIPPGFMNMMGDAVPVMGGHAWDPAKQPASAAEWTIPVTIIGYYNDEFLYYEPMAPVSFFIGDTDNFWEEDISYENQTIDNLATYQSITYDATSGQTTFTFKGPSSVCNKEPPSSSPDEGTGNNPDNGSGSATGQATWWHGMMMVMIAAWLF